MRADQLAAPNYIKRVAMFPIPQNNEDSARGPPVDNQGSGNSHREMAKRDSARRSLLQRPRRLMGEVFDIANVNTAGA
jgi:hypothetical protein